MVIPRAPIRRLKSLIINYYTTAWISTTGNMTNLIKRLLPTSEFKNTQARSHNRTRYKIAHELVFYKPMTRKLFYDRKKSKKKPQKSSPQCLLFIIG